MSAREKEPAAAVRLILYFDSGTAPALPFMEMYEVSWLQINPSKRESLVFVLLERFHHCPSGKHGHSRGYRMAGGKGMPSLTLIWFTNQDLLSALLPPVYPLGFASTPQEPRMRGQREELVKGGIDKYLSPNLPAE